MIRARRIRLAALACAAALQAAYAPLAAQGRVEIVEVTQLLGSPMCGGKEAAYQVSLRDGTRPPLKFRVVLDPEPDKKVVIRFELLDAGGNAVEMADSASALTQNDPPWTQRQGLQTDDHRLGLENRRPTHGGSRFRIRVTIPGTKASAVESRVFQLHWPELTQQACKPLTDSRKPR